MQELCVLRRSKGLSQKGLGKALKMSSGAIGMWESGKRTPSLKTAKKVASFFGTTIENIEFQTKKEQP